MHMDLSAMPTVFSSHHSWYMAALACASDNAVAAATTANPYLSSYYSKLIYSYRNAIHGFSAILSPSELEALKRFPGYVSSYRDFPVKADTTQSAKFLGLNANSGVWPMSNYGKDVIIGLVDTGIWPESRSFNDDGMAEIPSRWKGECEDGTQFNSSMCNKKLIGARFFNKGLIAKHPNVSISMNSTRDTDGHGTHTSTTAAGNYVEGASYFGYGSGAASGMAPRAHVAMYKALWDVGGFASDIIAAIDQAIIDGVDVMSLSLGLDGVPLYEDPIAIATFAALEKGIFVATSAGNEGPFLGTLHNGIPWVLTVAASTMDRLFGGTVTLGNGVSVIGSSLYPANSSPSQVPIVFMGSCENLTELKKVGFKIVVCHDQSDSLSIQVDYVNTARVAGGVFITNYPDIEFFMQSSFPATFMNPETGEIIMDYIKKSSEPKASIEFSKTILGAKPAPRMASYSSRGPSPSCPIVLKPDLTGPGALILASWPKINPVADVNSRLLYSEFNLLSGTSMSCPHAAGVGALLKGAHPEWSPAAIRSAMMTTSDSLDNTLSPIKDIGDDNQPASPLAMGSGHINPNKAMDPGLIYDVNLEDYVNLLCALNFSDQQIQAITRSSSNSCSQPSLDLNYPSFIAFFNTNGSASNAKTVQEFSRTVTNIGEGMSTYNAQVTGMEGFRVSVVPDELVFKEKHQKLSYKLRIEVWGPMKETVAFGSLSWVDFEAKHVVRSPIVVTTL